MADKTKNVLDETTWEFLKTGWWISHILVIVIVAYLGFLFWPR